MSSQPYNKALARGNKALARGQDPKEATGFSSPPGNFHNPYNFIPAPKRNTAHPELGDAYPKGHGVYHAQCWSGRIAVRLTTKTPLLLPDAADADTDGRGHTTFETRLVDGKPYLAPTSIKGMLRTAYEAITNSRFGVFEKHQERLAYRMPADAKADVIPARVECTESGLVLRLMNSQTLQGGYAAMLPRYVAGRELRENCRNGAQLPSDKGESQVALRYSEDDQELPLHGDHVWVRFNAKGYVLKDGIRRWQTPLPDEDNWYEGWVCITGANIDDKKNERVFLPDEEDQKIPVDDRIKDLWRELIYDYQLEHKKDLEKREQEHKRPDEYSGRDPGGTAWSRHVYTLADSELTAGTLCYVELDMSGDVSGVQPVIISRRLFEEPPIELVDDSLKPAGEIADLSPADRVFGWVKQQGKGSYKGNLRIHGVTCESKNPIEDFPGEGLALAILGQPRPSQFRFYNSDKQGNPISPTAEKRGGFNDDQTIRGRKVYPHHKEVTDNYWDNPTNRDERNYLQSKHLSEDKRRSNQNRSIKSWVKTNVDFAFTIDVTNLSTVELGALLWLLTLPPQDHFHRLGGGKPLGFGSVSVTLDDKRKTDLRTGSQWQNYYDSLLPIEPPTCDIDEVIQEFKEAVKTAYESDFEATDFIKAFLVMAKGFEDGLPIHYPRVAREPDPKGEGFKWFVDNERSGKEGGQRLPLPVLNNEKGLPFNPKKK